MSVVVKSGCEKSEKVHKRKSNRAYCCPQMKCCTTECSPCPPPKCLSCPPKCPPCPPCPPKCSPCSPCPPCPPKCSPCSPCPPVMECVPVCTTTALVQCPMIQGAVYWNGVKKTTCYSIVPACPAPSCCYYPYTPTGCS